MNEILEAIRTRQSVKSYRAEPVPNDLLSEIVSAGTYAASGMNRQSPIILNITDRTVRDMLSDLNRRVGGWQGDFDPFYGAPNVLCVLADKAVGTYLYDGSLVMGNLMLAAHALGISSCWIHRAKEVFEMPEGKEILQKLDITGNYEGIGFCILGYAKGEYPAAKPRRENRIFTV